MTLKLSNDISDRIMDAVYRDNPKGWLTPDDYVEVARLFGKLAVTALAAAGRKAEDFPDLARQLVRDYHKHIDSQQPVIPNTRVFQS